MLGTVVLFKSKTRMKLCQNAFNLLRARREESDSRSKVVLFMTLRVVHGIENATQSHNKYKNVYFHRKRQKRENCTLDIKKDISNAIVSGIARAAP